jgi:hypothetical protein
VPVVPVGAALPAAPAQAPSPRASFSARLEAHAPSPTPAPSATPRSLPLAALAQIEQAQRRLDGVIQAARAGRTFTAQELIGLQAQAYRFTQTVDLASKLVESGAQSLKQALNTPL